MASNKVNPASAEEANERRDLLRAAYVNALFGYIRREPGKKVPIYKFVTPEMKMSGAVNKRWIDSTLAKYPVLNPSEFDTAE